MASKRIAFLATDGVEQIELTKPWDELKSAGFQVELLSNKDDEIQGFHHRDRGDTFPVDRLVGKADVSDYDGLVLPGGVVNPDRLRMDPDAVGFVKSFFDRGTPVAAICHAPWMLVEADVVRGRTLTSWPSLKTDIRNAGGDWLDEEIVEDQGLVTSRSPDDLEAFCKKSIEIFGE